MEKRLQRFSNSLIDSLVLLCLVLVFVYSAYALWDVNTIYQHAEASNFTEYKPSGESPEARMSFAALQKLNPDVLGWLTLYDTAIDYPLVQAEDNFTYLDKTVEGDYSAAGSLFLDYRSQPDFSDWNTIVHGHHMAARAMFGDIGLYEDEGYFKEHLYGDLFYEGRHYGLEVFALVLTDTSDGLLFTPGVQGVEAQTAYLKRIEEKVRNKADVEIGPEDRILVMATCSGLITNGRHMLVAKILDEPVANPYPEPPSKDELLKNRTGMGAVFASNEEGRMTNLLLLLALIFLLCLLAYLILEMKNRRLEAQMKTAALPLAAVPPRPPAPQGPTRERRPLPRKPRTLHLLALGLLTAYLALTMSSLPVAAQASPIRQTTEGAEAIVSFKQRVYGKYYGAEPNPNSYIRYEFLAQETGNPMPGGQHTDRILLDLRIGRGDEQNAYELLKQLEPIAVTGQAPQEYRYKLRALFAYGPGAADLELDDRVYEILLQYVELPSQGTNQPSNKLLLVFELPDAKPSEMVFNHTYAGSPESSEEENQDVSGVVDSSQPGEPQERPSPGEVSKPQDPPCSTEPQNTSPEPQATRPDGTPVPSTGERGLPPSLILLFLLALTILLGWRYQLEVNKRPAEPDMVAADRPENPEE